MTKTQRIKLVEKALKFHDGNQAALGRELDISRQYINDMLKGRNMSDLWVYRFKEYIEQKGSTSA